MIIGYINGQSLELHHSKVVEKSVDYLTADFQFMTNEWKGFRKWVHFCKGDIHYQIELKNDKILKTDHLNLSSGEWDVYIHGSLEREIITTNKAKLIVEVTGELEGQYPEETPIPPYDYILNQIGSLEGLETEAKENLVAAINEIFQTVNDDKRVGVVEIKQTVSSSENGGLNEITMLLTDGTVRTFTYRNGQKGEKGDKGDKGDKGENGEDYVLTDSDKEEIAEKVTLNNDVGNAVKATANGEVIRVDDVSPIEHKVKAKISGDGIDFYNVTLFRYGKNLFDVNVHKTNPQYCDILNNTENKYTVQGGEGKETPLAHSTGAFQVRFNKDIKVFDKVTVSVYVTLLEIGKFDNRIRVSERNTSGVAIRQNDFELEINKRQKISVIYDATRGSINAVTFYLNTNKVLIEVDTLQVEIGNVATEYETYTEESCKPSADGTAKILSVSPTMTLFTDTDGANIGIEYNQNINNALDRVISELPGGSSGNIAVDDIAERAPGTENDYVPETNATYWKDNTTIDRIDGTFVSSVYPTCVTPEIYVVSGAHYKVDGNCYENDVYQYGFDGALVEVTSLINNEVFKVCDNTAVIRFIVPKTNYNADDLDLNGTIEHFNSNFKLYYCDRYKLKDNVEVPAIGDKSKLKTENKTSLVDAINELVENPSFDTEGVPGGGGTIPVIETDTTLTQEGVPADAKAVGDRFNVIEEKLFEVENLIDESGVIAYDNTFKD